jgi:hypothetical protein
MSTDLRQQGLDERYEDLVDSSAGSELFLAMAAVLSRILDIDQRTNSEESSQ